ncbi:5-oxoprolinase/urea amidolyase family protein [Photorhabdus noenieputensis]|uniref:5-oxoprolinase subunit B/C family protein n=1 Tax=Photorhabdus noenieputensis TaxID=1208607 RepID=UPI001BD48BB3|nr:5-oxoprolinase/urea amidolyase family protein [Photorhabdus noenieputensis]MBS9438013.1 5-oxoprolinase/urea amidolyase family protein [Photorhabdus noenieputensis]MCK3671330.1 5-oxoprolinase/urea amidolyase family protein [Photorhabdus noenieputensis]
MRFLPVNLDAIIVELHDLNETLALFESLNVRPIAGVEEIIPAARTLLIRFRPNVISTIKLTREINSRNLNTLGKTTGKLVEIPVYYTGEDLEEVAEILGITTQEVIKRHTESEYTVAFTGFAPGFAYLVAESDRLHVPRRTTPRASIPAGSVGLAGEFSGIYPQASPGGWQIIGITPERMWDLSRSPSSLLQPGFRVHFRDQRKGAAISITKSKTPVAPIENVLSSQVDKHASLEILTTGIQTLFQDLGRSGQASLGISAAGALDKTALRSANRIVGNPSDNACLEIVQGGLSFISHGNVIIAVTGADCPITVQTTSGRKFQVDGYQPVDLSEGDKVTLGTPKAGMRSYLAVRGGFAQQPILSSLSYDTLAHIGPKPIATGDTLDILTLTQGSAVSMDESPAFNMPTSDDIVTLDIVLGPRTDWFTAEALSLLQSQLWQVTPQSNRVGIRLHGDTPLARLNHKELPSEGTTTGAIQVPASGQPVLFLADHPLTGGYPVIGSVASYHLDLAGQIPVNARIRFNLITEFHEIKESDCRS